MGDPLARVPHWSLSFLLTCLVAALLCHCDSMNAVGQWCEEHRPLLRHLFGPRQHLPPSESLYRKLLPRLAPAALEWALASWLLHTRSYPDPGPVGLDGKTAYGAAMPEDTQPHVRSVSAHQTGETIIQVQADAKANEIPVAQRSGVSASRRH